MIICFWLIWLHFRGTHLKAALRVLFFLTKAILTRPSHSCSEFKRGKKRDPLSLSPTFNESFFTEHIINNQIWPGSSLEEEDFWVLSWQHLIPLWEEGGNYSSLPDDDDEGKKKRKHYNKIKYHLKTLHSLVVPHGFSLRFSPPVMTPCPPVWETLLLLTDHQNRGNTDLHEMIYTSQKLRVDGKSAVQFVSRLGNQAHGKLSLEHQHSTPGGGGGGLTVSVDMRRQTPSVGRLCLTWRKVGAAGAWRQKVMKSAQRKTVPEVSAKNVSETRVWERNTCVPGKAN